MPDHGRIEKANQRYAAAGHRVQTAIAAMPDHPNQTPKHLRTGVDMSKSDQAGLAKLLMDKGLFTLEEYIEAMANQAEIEADQYEHELSIKHGINITTL